MYVGVFGEGLYMSPDAGHSWTLMEVYLFLYIFCLRFKTIITELTYTCNSCSRYKSWNSFSCVCSLFIELENCLFYCRTENGFFKYSGGQWIDISPVPNLGYGYSFV